MRRNIDDLLCGLLTGLLCGLVIGQAGMRRLRGKVRWEGNLDESRLGRFFDQHRKVTHP